MEITPNEISGKVPTGITNGVFLTGGMNAQVITPSPPPVNNVEMNATMGMGEIPNLDKPKPTAKVTELDLNGGKIMAKQQVQNPQQQYPQYPQQQYPQYPQQQQPQYPQRQPQYEEKGIFDQIDFTSIGIGAVIGAGVGYLILNND